MHKRTNMMYIMRKNKGLSFKLPVSKITFWINTESIQHFHTHSGLLFLLSYILRIEHENKFYKKNSTYVYDNENWLREIFSVSECRLGD